MLIQIDKKERNEAREAVGGLSSPSKMPCYSWSIPAQSCHVGSKLAKLEGSVCFGCYALKGFYRMPSVEKALNRRKAKLKNLTAWKKNFVVALQGEKFFRWLDSGDIQSPRMLDAINSIAKDTPHVLHWLPTKEHKLIAEYLAAGKTLATNLKIRLSAYMVDSQKVPETTGLKSIVLSADLFASMPESPTLAKCRAPEQGGKCLDCRACWSDIRTIAYKKH